MEWIVRGTAVFDAWFDGLNEPEQGDVIAAIDLLKQFGPHLGFRTARRSTVRGILTCGSCGYNTLEGRTGFCTRSIQTSGGSSGRRRQNGR